MNVWLWLGRFFEFQCTVTYEHEPFAWKAYVPEPALNRLPKTISKLLNKEAITIGVCGDSISAGCDSNFFHQLPPYGLPYTQRVVEGLQNFYGGKIILKNRAVGGWAFSDGLKDFDHLLEDKPDLIFIAFGMNDVPQNNPVAFQENIKKMIQKTRDILPESEVILISTMLGNSDWILTPEARFYIYRDQLKSLVAPGVGLVDMTAVWQALLKRKTFWDITGNGVNHPNDFGHRIYAEMILQLLRTDRK
jgi:acyl-CoA thioesterase I